MCILIDLVWYPQFVTELKKIYKYKIIELLTKCGKYLSSATPWPCSINI